VRSSRANDVNDEPVETFNVGDNEPSARLATTTACALANVPALLLIGTLVNFWIFTLLLLTWIVGEPLFRR
jgi:hypothetical protein